MPSLEALAALERAGTVRFVAVVTQPDRVGARGRIAVPPVKEHALAHGLPVLQPAALRGDGLDDVLSFAPDLLVWAAYGQRIPSALLEAVRGRAVNVHASLLPRWRGAAPVAWAILAGDRETGVTLMEGTARLDAGAIVAQETTPIGPDETAGELTARLAKIGARVLVRDLPRYLSGEIVARGQDRSRATWAPKLVTADGELRFTEPAERLARRVRAMTPEPGAFTTFRGARLVVVRASVAGGSASEPGTLELRDSVPHVAAGAGWLRLEEVRPAGKRTMSGADWARGARLAASARLPS